MSRARRTEQLDLFPERERERERLGLNLLEYWQEAAKQHQYPSVTSALLGLYRKTGSISGTSRLMGFCRATIREKLKRLGEYRPRTPGGNNNPWGRAGKPDTQLGLYE